MSQTKIEHLTPEQIARFGEFREKWMKIGLCTDPADRPRAEAGVRLAYETAGLKPPEQIVWCGSPFSMAMTRAKAIGLHDHRRNHVLESVGFGVWRTVLDDLKASVLDSVKASIGDSVLTSVREYCTVHLFNAARDFYDNFIRPAVNSDADSSVGFTVIKPFDDFLWDANRGQHDSHWLSGYDYLRHVCNLSKQTQPIVGHLEVAQSAGCWLTYTRVCWISERPNIIKLNDRFRLHCETGPALVYPDKWSIWSIGGVRVDEQIVMKPETQTVEQIKAEPNEEVRRVRIERFGWVRFLRESGAKKKHERHNDRDAQREELYELEDGTKRLRCVDPSTGREYFPGVPRDIETCEQAQNWMSHNLDQYATHRS